MLDPKAFKPRVEKMTLEGAKELLAFL